MQDYQLYPITPEGVPMPGRPFAGYNDAEALVMARLMVGEEQAEVWQGPRWVGWLNPPPVGDGRDGAAARALRAN